MCNFFSGIVKKDFSIICNPTLTDSHEDLIKACGLFDTKLSLFNENFARFEFTTKDVSDYQNINNWDLHIDENVIPDWCKENAEVIKNKIWNIVNKMFINDERDFLFGNCYILLDNAKINEAKCCRIYSMYGEAEIKKVNDCKINNMYGNSVVKDMSGNSVVNNMYDNSVVPINAKIIIDHRMK